MAPDDSRYRPEAVWFYGHQDSWSLVVYIYVIVAMRAVTHMEWSAGYLSVLSAATHA